MHTQKKMDLGGLHARQNAEILQITKLIQSLDQKNAIVAEEIAKLEAEVE